MLLRVFFAVISAMAIVAPGPAVYGSGVTLTVNIPDCIITSTNGYDLVEIPGGGTLLAEEGRPLVPYYFERRSFPPGERVQNLNLTAKAGMKTFSNLKLAPAVFEEYPFAPVGVKSGWYPELEYNWQVVDTVDGGTTLELMIYPFFYNPDTGEAYFFQRYDFEVLSTLSEISFTRVLLNGGLYHPGDTVVFEMNITNSGPARDAVIGLEIKRFGTAGLAAGLPLKLLKNVRGDVSCVMYWESSADCDGDYYAEIIIYSATGEVLDRINSRPVTMDANAPPVTLEPYPNESMFSLTELWERYKIIILSIGGGLILLIVLLAISRALGKK